MTFISVKEASYSIKNKLAYNIVLGKMKVQLHFWLKMYEKVFLRLEIFQS